MSAHPALMTSDHRGPEIQDGFRFPPLGVVDRFPVQELASALASPRKSLETRAGSTYLDEISVQIQHTSILIIGPAIIAQQPNVIPELTEILIFVPIDLLLYLIHAYGRLDVLVIIGIQLLGRQIKEGVNNWAWPKVFVYGRFFKI